jgi:hypothetical protein
MRILWSGNSKDKDATYKDFLEADPNAILEQVGENKWIIKASKMKSSIPVIVEK